jgi:hypothetical protein
MAIPPPTSAHRGLNANQQAVGNALEGAYKTTLTGPAATLYTTIRATGGETGLPYLLGLMAETLAGAGRRDWALYVLVSAHGDQSISAKCTDSARFRADFTFRVVETGLAG